MLLAVSMAALAASCVALFFKRIRILGAVGLLGSLGALAFEFSSGTGGPVRFEGALGAVQILSLTEAPETTTPQALRQLAEERCGVRTVCQIVIHPDSATAQQAIADNAAEQGAIAIYLVDVNQARAGFITRCGVWAGTEDECFTPQGE